MARLVVALIALAIMSAGSMYWASAQQISETGPVTGNVPIKASAFGAFNLSAADTQPADQPAHACPDCGGCDKTDGVCPMTKESSSKPSAPPCKKRRGCCPGS